MTPTEQIAASRIAMYAAMETATPHNDMGATPQAGLILQVLKTMGDEELRPIAQRHPVALMVGSAAVGALLVQTKPWRLLAVPLVTQALLTALAGFSKARTP